MDVPHRAIANPKTHYGSPKLATMQFVVQRLSGMLNIVFLLFFVGFVVHLAGRDRAEMIDTVRNPFVALVLCLLIINVCVHMRIGMNEVLEDYFDEPRVHRLLRFLNTVFAVLVSLVTVIAVGKIVFWG